MTQLSVVDSDHARGSERLPHNYDAEMATLGSVLIRSDVFPELAGILATDDFLLPAHREIWEAMQACDRRGHLEALSLLDELRVRGMVGRLPEGEGYILTLSNVVPTAEAARHYARIVRDKAVRRRLIAVCKETAARAGGDAGLDELLVELRQSIDSLEAPSEAGPVRIGDILDDATAAIERRAAEPSIAAVMTGLRALDEIIRGFRPGQQIVVAANPGGGKSSFAWTTAIRAAMAGVPALCFSLEMSVQELTERALTFAGNVPGVTAGDLNLEEWRKVRVAQKNLQPLPLWVDDRKLSMGRIAAEARRWRAQHAREGLALLVVDYLGLVRSDGDAENRQLEVAAWSRAFKTLAGDLKCPLILVAQLNRQNMSGGTPREPVLSDLRDSGAVEQDADMVIFPWREGTLAKLIVAKHRNGATGAAKKIIWRGDLMAFYDDVGPGFAPVPTGDDF